MKILKWFKLQTVGMPNFYIIEIFTDPQRCIYANDITKTVDTIEEAIEWLKQNSFIE